MTVRIDLASSLHHASEDPVSCTPGEVPEGGMGIPTVCWALQQHLHSLSHISKFRVIDFNLLIYGFTDGIVQSHLSILTKRTIIIENFCRRIVDLGLCYCRKHIWTARKWQSYDLCFYWDLFMEASYRGHQWLPAPCCQQTPSWKQMYFLPSN